MDAARTRSPSAKFEAFDGLRAIAAFLVIGYHVSLAEGLSRTGVLAPFAAELKGGVAIFFVISGFLLYLPYARAIRDRERLPNWREYARRRATRILPGYWFALTVLGVAGLAASVFTVGWWRYYGFAQIYSSTTFTGGLRVGWSLCVEVTFYLCLPLFARLMAFVASRNSGVSPARSQLVVVGAIGLFSILLRVAVCHSLVMPVPGPGVVLETALPGALDWFAIGIALAVVATTWEVEPERFGPVRWLSEHGILAWTLAAACYMVGAWEQHGDLFLPLYGVVTHVALGLTGALLVLPAIARRSRTAPVRVLSTPFLAWLGVVSYGIYLWHYPWLRLIHGSYVPPAGHAAPISQAILLYLATVGGAIALGALSWYLVERPAQRLLRRRRSASLPGSVGVLDAHGVR